MFTIEQLKTAHAKVKSGADFPAYIREIKILGVKNYTTFIYDGHTVFTAQNGEQKQSEPKYGTLYVALTDNSEKFKQELKLHQQGGSDYITFCRECAANGIEKWMVDTDEMTCTYYDHAGNAVLVEEIPG